MKYVRGSTLLPLTSEAMRFVPRTAYQGLRDANLLIYDEGVSNFFFEFEPEEEMQRFLLHAQFAGRTRDKLLACKEDLHDLAAKLGPNERPPPKLVLPSDGGKLPTPLRFIGEQVAFETIRRQGRFRGRITCCSCGIAGCFAQYAWVERYWCLFLFTVNGATLTDVEYLPFRVADS